MEALIEKSISGNEKAYSELIESIKFDLYRVAKSRLTNEDDIDDAFQETIIKSYQNLDKLENKKYFKTWITRILINECNNINQSNIKSANLFNKVVGKSDFQAFTNTTNNIDNSIYIDELLDKLDDDEKEIAHLYFRDNFTADKIAQILNSNKNTVKSKIYRIRLKLKKLAMLILILCLITTTTVFAIKFIVSLFTTSRQAIDTAVENDYVQNVDMDFTYDKDIGIKVDYILIDNKNLDVSYVYDCNSYKNVSNVKLIDYTITDENDNTIYTTDLHCLTHITSNYGTPTKIDNELIRSSNLYTATTYFPISNKLIFNINVISLITGDKFEDVSGNWCFEINLEDKFLNRDSAHYLASYSEYIKDISATIDKTSLIVDIELIDDINKNYIYLYDSIVLKNDTNHQYQLTFYKINNNNVHLIFDIGEYNENINNLNLYVKFDEQKYIDIKLEK